MFTQFTTTAQQFSINQIVKGKRFGQFVILGYEHKDGLETLCIVKEMNPHTGELARGEMKLPESCFEAIY